MDHIAEPLSFSSRIFRQSLCSDPIKPSRRRKHRKAYFSLGTPRSLAVIRLDFLAIWQRAVTSLVYTWTLVLSASWNQGKEILPSSLWMARSSVPNAFLKSPALEAIRLRNELINGDELHFFGRFFHTFFSLLLHLPRPEQPLHYVILGRVSGKLHRAVFLHHLVALVPDLVYLLHIVLAFWASRDSYATWVYHFVSDLSF